MAQFRKLLVILGCLSLLAAAGCADQKKKDGDVANADAERIKQLQDEMARLNSDNAAAQDRINALLKENTDLKTQLTQGGAPAEAPAPGWKSVPGGMMIALDGKVLFDSGKSVLRTKGQTTLNEIAATIKSKHPDYDVYVFGHTDDQPIKRSGWKDNYELSCERALSVVRYLSKRGISTKQLAACGWGEHRPVASNRTAAERAMNRRVEIFVMSPHGTSVPSAGEIKGP